jgi:hypothetical protein
MMLAGAPKARSARHARAMFSRSGGAEAHPEFAVRVANAPRSE